MIGFELKGRIRISILSAYFSFQQVLGAEPQIIRLLLELLRQVAGRHVPRRNHRGGLLPREAPRPDPRLEGPARAAGEGREESPRTDPAPSAAGEAGGTQDSATANKVREADNFAATGIGAKTEFPVEWVAFEEDPEPAARIALRYEFRPELIRLGLLSRENDLDARDRARGFERDYAPDPYGQRR